MNMPLPYVLMRLESYKENQFYERSGFILFFHQHIDKVYMLMVPQCGSGGEEA